MKNDKAIKILVCCHQKVDWLKNDIYVPVHCGKIANKINLGIQGDDTGDNISSKNPNYCELTALYWAWKNWCDIDYIGLNHYRRYFCKDKLMPTSRVYVYESVSIAADHIVMENDIERYLCLYDIILPKKNYCPFNLRTEYSYMLNSIEYKRCKDVVMRLFPEYIPSFEQIMYYGNSYSACNMFIMKWELFDKYAEWMFSILFELEKQLCIDGYTGYYKRIYGYVSERLLNIFVLHHNLNAKYLPVAMISNTYKTGLIKETCKRIISDISFIINKPRKKEEIFSI